MIFDDIFGALIGGPVGNNAENNEDDVRSVRRTLEDNGYIERSERDEENWPLGLITRELDRSIRSFQRDHDLKEDGLLNPGGETETTLTRTAQQKQQDGIHAWRERLAPPPKPQRKPEILHNADDQRATDFIKEQEDTINHLYKDNRGNLTIGIGHKASNIEEVKNLPFHIYKDGQPIRRATQTEIERMVHQVEVIPHGQNVGAARYSSSQNSEMEDLRIPDQEIEAMLKRDLHARAQQLRKNWPELDNLPEEIQISMLDAIFNMGEGEFTPHNWPNFQAAINKDDWESAAKEIHRKTEHEKRNKAVQKLIRSIPSK